MKRRQIWSISQQLPYVNFTLWLVTRQVKQKCSAQDHASTDVWRHWCTGQILKRERAICRQAVDDEMSQVTVKYHRDSVLTQCFFLDKTATQVDWQIPAAATSKTLFANPVCRHIHTRRQQTYIKCTHRYRCKWSVLNMYTRMTLFT